MNTLTGTSKKQIALAVLLFDFAALTAYAVAEYGVVGVFAAAFANAATITLAVDLTIALSLVVAWMWQDARARGVSPIPYVVLTLGLGSIGPLLYLVRRAGDPAPARTAVAPTTAYAARS
jgi:Protein of unknown function DUF2834